MTRILAFLVLLTGISAQQRPSENSSYQRHCDSCHGSDLGGGSGPAIRRYVQYHTDVEVSQKLHTPSHQDLNLGNDELREVLADLRKLTGTNPSMATGGFTGKRIFVWGSDGRMVRATEADNQQAPEAKAPASRTEGRDAFNKVCSGCHTTQVVTTRGDTEAGWRQIVSNMVERGAKGTDEQFAAIVQYLAQNFPPKDSGISPAKKLDTFTSSTATFEQFPRHRVTITLVDGKPLDGVLINQSASSAQLLTDDGSLHLLSREGDHYKEKPIFPKTDWITYHGDPSGNRYSRLEEINTASVQRLGTAWTFNIPTSSRLQATPLVVDGVLYVTGWNELYALDATTGEQIWSYRQPRTEGLLSEAGQGSNHGVALAGDRVILMTDDAHLHAFDRKTGNKLWEVSRGAVENAVSATPAPLIVGDLVVVGVSGGEEGIRGFIDAYKVSTGEHVWRFYTIPKRGEKGSETWVGEALEHGCGSTWMTGSYDPGLDLIYWGTGNPCPDYNGSERLGDNLYTNSVVALSAKTGKLQWYFQFTPHDTHDWDSTQSMILVDTVWNGQRRKLLLHGDRNGYFFVLDRTDGKLLLAKPLSTKVTWTTGYGKDGRPVLTSTSEATPEGTAACPGGMGGANWTDPSFSPITNLFYVRVADSCGLATSGNDPLGRDNRWTGSGQPTEKGRQALAALVKDYKGGSYIRAMDIQTGEKVWDYPVEERTGVLSTAGNLVFIGASGGVDALDAKTGKKLTGVNSNQRPTALPVFAASPMTYMVGGTQYLALAGMGNVTAYALPAKGEGRTGK